MAKTNTSIQISQPLPSGTGRVTITAHVDATPTSEDRDYIAALITALARWLGVDQPGTDEDPS